MTCISRWAAIVVTPIWISVGILDRPAAALPTTSASSATDLYDRAAKAIAGTDCPSNSNLTYPGYPPFGPDWDQYEQTAWEKNAAARTLVHQAALIDHADWPTGADPTYLNHLRAIANEVADAALYQHLHADDAGAFQTIDDLLHIATLLRQHPEKNKIPRPLVAVGIDAMACYRLLVITAAVKLTDDPKNTQDLQISTAKKLIDFLLDQKDPATQFAELLDPNTGIPNADRMHEVIAKVYAERSFAAMSLACHLYQSDKHTWPQSLADLVPTYLPHMTIDPWGDGKQTLDYVLIKAGLPNGGDRPLVYSRCLSRDGLFYRIDEPEYGFYRTDGSKLPPAQRLQGGQFRDITAWIPGPVVPNAPSLEPLP